MASSKTKIEWTESTWNPITGCTPISPGCKNCYAMRLAKRLRAMGNARYSNGFQVTLHEDLLRAPLSWKKPRLIFVNSMSDLFHEDVPIEYIQRIFKTMREARQHTFQVLTKRSSRMAKIADQIDWPLNVWMGVTIESGDYNYRADNLRATKAAVRFLSIEPMIDQVSGIDLKGIDWVIVGGESGPKSRPMNENWVKEIRDLCVSANVSFFFKQWGGVNKKKTGRLLDGKNWDEYPNQRICPYPQSNGNLTAYNIV